MPSIKQGGGYTLTFSKKNKDVEKILADKKKNGIVITDYICNAVRAFEDNTNNSQLNINTLNIEKIVQKQVALALTKVNTNEITNEKISLENDLDDVDIDED
ncbi:hypothetical protein [Clostridium sp. ZS2]|uniref:hypothetical protein n=1 Tax=Clostridium sp. ZS2 TaxID=2949988 RepID=UPI00207AA817|nr:hypothetical protein [Clostridium sp. ZS2]